MFSLLTATLLLVPAENRQAPPVELKPIKYPALMKTIAAYKGKVVVLDIWADWCVPCKMAFPHHVQLHRKYGGDGLVCLSLSLDPAKGHESALAFLKKMKATFPNFRLDEEDSVWQDKFDLNGPPAVLIWDRQGKLVKKFDVNNPDVRWDHNDIEKLIKELLKKK